MTKNWIKFAFVALVFQSGTAIGGCVFVPDDPEKAVIKVCENDAEYVFSQDGVDRTYGKEDFQTYMIGTFEEWLQGTGFGASDLCGTRVEYWLSIPDSAPEATQARVMVRSEAGNFLAFLPLGAEGWLVDDNHMSVLGQDFYPRSLGYRPGIVHLKKTPETTFDRLAAHAEELSLKNYTHLYGDWGSFEVPAFHEEWARERVLSDGDSAIIADVGFNWIFEWIAFKKHAFSFDWICDRP